MNNPFSYNSYLNLCDLEALIALAQKQLVASYQLEDVTEQLLTQVNLHSNCCLSAKATEVLLSQHQQQVKPILTLQDFATCLQQLALASQQLTSVTINQLHPSEGQKSLSNYLHLLYSSQELEALRQVDYNSNKHNSLQHNHLWLDVSCLQLPLNQLLLSNNYNLSQLLPFVALHLTTNNNSNGATEETIQPSITLAPSLITGTSNSIDNFTPNVAYINNSLHSAPVLTKFVLTIAKHLDSNSNSRALLQEVSSFAFSHKVNSKQTYLDQLNESESGAASDNQLETSTADSSQQLEAWLASTEPATINAVATLLAKLHLYLSLQPSYLQLDVGNQSNIYFITLAYLQLRHEQASIIEQFATLRLADFITTQLQALEYQVDLDTVLPPHNEKQPNYNNIIIENSDNGLKGNLTTSAQAQQYSFPSSLTVSVTNSNTQLGYRNLAFAITKLTQQPLESLSQVTEQVGQQAQTQVADQVNQQIATQVENKVDQQTVTLRDVQAETQHNVHEEQQHASRMASQNDARTNDLRKSHLIAQQQYHAISLYLQQQTLLDPFVKQHHKFNLPDYSITTDFDYNLANFNSYKALFNNINQKNLTNPNYLRLLPRRDSITISDQALETLFNLNADLTLLQQQHKQYQKLKANLEQVIRLAHHNAGQSSDQQQNLQNQQNQPAINNYANQLLNDFAQSCHQLKHELEQCYQLLATGTSPSSNSRNHTYNLDTQELSIQELPAIELPVKQLQPVNLFNFPNLSACQHSALNQYQPRSTVGNQSNCSQGKQQVYSTNNQNNNSTGKQQNCGIDNQNDNSAGNYQSNYSRIQQLLSPATLVAFLDEQVSGVTQLLYLLSHNQLSNLNPLKANLNAATATTEKLRYHLTIKDEDVTLPNNWLALIQAQCYINSHHDQIIGQWFYTVPITIPTTADLRKSYYQVMHDLIAHTTFKQEQLDNNITTYQLTEQQLVELRQSYQQALADLKTCNSARTSENIATSQTTNGTDAENLATESNANREQLEEIIANLEQQLHAKQQLLINNLPWSSSATTDLIFNASQVDLTCSQNSTNTKVAAADYHANTLQRDNTTLSSGKLPENQNFFLAHSNLYSDAALQQQLTSNSSITNSTTSTSDLSQLVNRQTNNNQHSTREQQGNYLLANVTGISGYVTISSKDGYLTELKCFSNFAPLEAKIPQLYRNFTINPLYLDLVAYLPHVATLPLTNFVANAKEHLISTKYQLYQKILQQPQLSLTQLQLGNATESDRVSVDTNQINAPNATFSYQPEVFTFKSSLDNKSELITGLNSKIYSKVTANVNNYASTSATTTQTPNPRADSSNGNSNDKGSTNCNNTDGSSSSINCCGSSCGNNNTVDTDLHNPNSNTNLAGFYYAQIPATVANSLAFYSVNCLNREMVANSYFSEAAMVEQIRSDLKTEQLQAQQDFNYLIANLGTSNQATQEATQRVILANTAVTAAPELRQALQLIGKLQLLNCSGSLRPQLEHRDGQFYSNQQIFNCNAGSFNHSVLIPLARVSLNLLPEPEQHYLLQLDNDTTVPYRHTRDLQHHFAHQSNNSNYQLLEKILGVTFTSQHCQTPIYQQLDCDAISQQDFHDRLVKLASNRNNRNRHFSYNQVHKHFSLRDYLRSVVTNPTITNNAYVTVFDGNCNFSDNIAFLNDLVHHGLSSCMVHDHLSNSDFLRLLFAYPNTQFSQYVLLDQNHLLNLYKHYQQRGYTNNFYQAVSLCQDLTRNSRLASNNYHTAPVQTQYLGKLIANQNILCQQQREAYNANFYNLSNNLAVYYENLHDLLALAHAQNSTELATTAVPTDEIIKTEATATKPTKSKATTAQTSAMRATNISLITEQLTQLQQVAHALQHQQASTQLSFSDVSKLIPTPFKHCLTHLPASYRNLLGAELSNSLSERSNQWNLLRWEATDILDHNKYQQLNFLLKQRGYTLEHALTSITSNSETTNLIKSNHAYLLNLIPKLIELTHSYRTKILSYLNCLYKNIPTDALDFNVGNVKDLYLQLTKFLALVESVVQNHQAWLSFCSFLQADRSLDNINLDELNQPVRQAFLNHASELLLLTNLKPTALPWLSLPNSLISNNQLALLVTEASAIYPTIRTNQASVTANSTNPNQRQTTATANQSKQQLLVWLSLSSFKQQHPYRNLAASNHLGSVTAKLHQLFWSYYATNLKASLSVKLQDLNIKYTGQYLPLTMATVGKEQTQHYCQQLDRPSYLQELPYYWCDLLSYSPFMNWRRQLINQPDNVTLRLQPTASAWLVTAPQGQAYPELTILDDQTTASLLNSKGSDNSTATNSPNASSSNNSESNSSNNIHNNNSKENNSSNNTDSNSNNHNSSNKPQQITQQAKHCLASQFKHYLISSLHTNLPLRSSNSRNGYSWDIQANEYLRLVETQRGRKANIIFTSKIINSDAYELTYLLANPKFRASQPPLLKNFTIRKDLLQLSQVFWDHDDFTTFDLLQGIAAFSPNKLLGDNKASLITNQTAQPQFDKLNNALLQQQDVGQQEAKMQHELVIQQVNATQKLAPSQPTHTSQPERTVTTAPPVQQKTTSHPAPPLQQSNTPSFFTTAIARTPWYQTITYPLGSFTKAMPAITQSLQTKQPVVHLRIINLDKDVGKLQAVLQSFAPIQQEFARAGLILKITRQSAVYGRNLSQAEIDARFDGQAFMHNYNRRATKGEIGCSLSYIELFSQVCADATIADSDYVVICEDDPVIFPNYSAKLINLLSQLHQQDQAGHKPPRWLNLTHFLINEADIYDGRGLEQLKFMLFDATSTVFGDGYTSWNRPHRFATIGTVNFLVRKDLIRQIVTNLGVQENATFPYTTSVKCSWLADDFIKIPGVTCADFALANPVLTSFSADTHEGSAIADERNFNIAYRFYLPAQRLQLLE